MLLRPTTTVLRLALTGVVIAAGATRVAAASEITTIAGTGEAADGGDLGPALGTNIGQPFGVEFGPDGALYITEVANHRVRRLDLTTGQLTTVAGCGRKGYAGDGGPAREALLNEPYEVRFDAAGDMFFVEMRNHVVRRVDKQSGLISTVAGTGSEGYAGDGGPAIHATLSSPHSIALDDRGGLYIADIGNHRIRRVDLASGVIESIAGNGRRELPTDGASARDRPMIGPRALFIEGRTLWIALRDGHSIWSLDLDHGVLSHVAGTGERGYAGDAGPAKSATFDGPKGVAIGADGRIVVADTENQAIRRIDPRSGRIETIAGRPATAAPLNRPHGVCVGPDGAVYIGDTENHLVRRVSP